MITNYNQFVDEKINEGLLSSIKGFFSSLFKNMSDQIKKPLDDMTKKLETTKDPKMIKKLINDYLVSNSKGLKTAIDSCPTPQDIVKTTKENLIAIYFSIDAVNKSFGDSKFKFEDIFNQSSDSIKKLFNKDEKNFNKNVLLFSKTIVVSFAKASGYDKTVLDELNKINEGFLFEADATTDPNQVANDVVNNATTADNGQEQQPTDNKPDPKLDKLKKSIITWFENTLFKEIREEITKIDSTTTTETDINAVKIDDEITKSKATNNKDSLKKILHSITQVDDIETLKSIRNLLNSKGVDISKDNAPL